MPQRPQIRRARKLCELPYDVMSSAEARQIARGKPFSFLRVSKPEIDLPEVIDPYSPQVYEKGRENFSRLISDGALKQDDQPFFYFYRQIMGSHSQTGLVATASCRDYLDGIIKKHEFTRPDKEDDRVRHMEILNSQTGPVFLALPAPPPTKLIPSPALKPRKPPTPISKAPMEFVTLPGLCAILEPSSTLR